MGLQACERTPPAWLLSNGGFCGPSLFDLAVTEMEGFNSHLNIEQMNKVGGQPVFLYPLIFSYAQRCSSSNSSGIAPQTRVLSIADNSPH